MRKFFVGSLLLGLFTYFFLFDSLKDDAEDIDLARLLHIETALRTDSKEVSANKEVFLKGISYDIKNKECIDTNISIVDFLKKNPSANFAELGEFEYSGGTKIYRIEFTTKNSEKAVIEFFGREKTIDGPGRVMAIGYSGPSISSKAGVNIAHFVYGISRERCQYIRQLYPGFVN